MSGRWRPDWKTAVGACFIIAWAIGIAMAGSDAKPTAHQSKSPGVPTIIVRPAPVLVLRGVDTPQIGHYGETDSNSPAHWDGDILYLFSSAGHPWRSAGPDLYHLTKSYIRVTYDNEVNGGRWLYSTWKDDDGTLYGWYHFEPHPVCENYGHLTAPQIGAVRSQDNGATWHDLGIVIKASAASVNCDTVNYYYAGGTGDLSVILDEKKEYFYLFFNYYPTDVLEQGVCVARMRYVDRGNPVGKVWKWHNGKWDEPGLDGRATPIFPAARDWHRKDANGFWGPSIHWNIHLKQYVILLNHNIDWSWTQEGIYVSFDDNLADPKAWTKPKKILDQRDTLDEPKRTLQGWYPQVIGTAKGETDKLAGRAARLFVHGQSRWEIIFLKPGEKAE